MGLFRSPPRPLCLGTVCGCGAVKPIVRGARAASLLAALILTSGCPGSPPAPTCTTDLDCRESARCVDGRCALELADAYTEPDAAPGNATLIITIVEPDSGVDEDAAR